MGERRTGVVAIAKDRRTLVRIAPVACAVLVAFIGVALNLPGRAATGQVAVEAESGTRQGGAQSVSETDASGGSAVKFSGSASSGSDACSTIPALPDTKPVVGVAGIPAGTTLTDSGSLSVSTPGMVINAENITGTVVVDADDVTIKNSRITMNAGYYAIRVMDGVTGTQIIHNELLSPSGAYTGITTGSSGAVICGNYIHHFENGITVSGTSVVQANLIEHLQSDASSPHYDAVEIYGGSYTKLWGNNLMMTDTSGNWLGETGAINLTGTFSPTDSIDLRGNWLGGGSYTVYVDVDGYTPSNVSIVGNTWYGSSPVGHAAYGPALIRNASSVTIWSGNKWEDRSTIDRP